MDLEEDWFPYQTGHRLARHFAELISDIFRSIDGAWDTIPDMEFGTKQYAYFVSV